MTTPDQKTNSHTPIVTRFAPSPTGLLHLGNYRTALFAYLFAQKHKGKFILRIEDTDKARSTKENEDNILESLTWIGLTHDEFYRQSDRSNIHKAYLEKLIAEGKAYVSKEINEQSSTVSSVSSGAVQSDRRSEVIRFKNPNKIISFEDAIRGTVTIDTTDLGDFVIAKSLTEPVFHLVVVVDDFEMGVTHIVRGEDHISNTPRHILIQEAIGAPRPIYAHLPLILAPDKTKLSKRKGALPLTHYRDHGYIPQAIINYLALLGWNPGTDKEIWSINELIEAFDFSGIQKSGAMFNQEKLDWFQKEYLKQLPIETVIDEIKKTSEARLSEQQLNIITPLVIDRIVTLNNIPHLFKIGGEFDFLIQAPLNDGGIPTYPYQKLLFKPTSDRVKVKEYLVHVRDIFAAHDFNSVDTSSGGATASYPDILKSLIWDYASSVGRGDVLWPLRFALTGKDKSADPFTCISLLGKEETLKRIDAALGIL